MEKETAEDVKEAVERDFQMHCRVAETDALMAKLLPVPDSVITKVLKKMEVNCCYVAGKWKAFPSPNAAQKEEEVYKAFISVANAIREAAEEVMKEEGSSHERLGANEWVDYHSRTPISQDTDGAPIRPDALLALLALLGLKQQVEKMESARAKKQESKATTSKLAVWWLQIVAVVEMKRSNTEDWKDLVKQLIGYLRRILREQLDRRFVFGFTLGPSQLNVWMHDRSGVLGTAKSINIHKDPSNFIRLISAFVVLSPDKLGFDPDIKLYLSPGIVIPSYRLDSDREAYSTNPYDTKWVIKFSNGKEYLTVKTLSIARAGIMRGRGTLTWVVVPYRPGLSSAASQASRSPQQDTNSTLELLREAPQIFVLKQTWRPLDSTSEDYYHQFAKGPESNFVGAIRHWEDVKINGEKDDTGKLIRQSLDANPPPTAAGSKRNRDENQEPHLHVYCTDENEIGSFWVEHAREPVFRIRTRILLSTYGWPLKYFSTLRELLRVLRGAIQGHKDLYVNGVLHRDISPGNILIEWNPGAKITPAKSSGRLIDLDHAKDGRKVEDRRSNTDQILDSDDLHIAALSIASEFKKNTKVPPGQFRIQEDVILRAFEVYPSSIRCQVYVVDAIQHALNFNHHPGDGTWSCMTLNWKQIVEKLYEFESDEREHGSLRTGTPPYTSGEILSDTSYFTHEKVYHDAVHDLESFFWVLVQICLTRKGPGGERREELTVDLKDVSAIDNERYQQLRIVVWCVFESDFGRLRDNKEHIFRASEIFERYILSNLHSYFDPLKPLMSEWFNLLRLAHTHRGLEYRAVHDRVLAILDGVLGSEDSELDVLNEAGLQVLKTREQDSMYSSDHAKHKQSDH
ncbi:hypothetical protein BDZ97DRAFT_988602 [Flammula alnicola]|nr:hypothetical protein BDZ97DRAFT_988602 [Flammula alnicola]